MMSEGVSIKEFGVEKVAFAKSESFEKWVVSAVLSQAVEEEWQKLFQEEWKKLLQTSMTTLPETAFTKKNMAIEVPCLRIETSVIANRLKQALKKANERLLQKQQEPPVEKVEVQVKPKGKYFYGAQAKSAEVQESAIEPTGPSLPKRKINLKIGMVYGSTTGNTAEVAEKIEEQFDDVSFAFKRDMANFKAADLVGAELLLVGIPTWNTGELQSDWDPVYQALDTVSLKGTKIAMFGLGDAVGYSRNFLDAMGILYQKLLQRGAEGGFGFWSTEGYNFIASKAIFSENPPKFCGLGIDKENQSQLTEKRIKDWVMLLRQELGS